MRRRIVIANRRRGGAWWRVPVVLLLWVMFAAPVAASIAAYSMFRELARDLPQAPDLDAWERNLPRTSVLRTRDGTVVAEIPFQDGEVVGRRDYTELGDVPAVLIQAVIAAEDVRFVQHRGVDVRAVVRAAWTNYQAGQVVEGASTITQQLARALLPEEIGNQRSLRRKVREAMVAFRLERRYGKRRLLEAYMNAVFLGAGAYGVSAAARAYFDKPLHELTLAEAALLAGLAQAPGRADPYKDIEAARDRRDDVLGRMARAGFISADEAAAARAQPVELHPPPQRYGAYAPWHTERARQEIERELGSAYRRGGLTVTTTALPGLALEAGARARDYLESRFRDPRPELGVIVWDHRTGYVELTLGGSSWEQSRFDRSTQACRQPGSAFKPLVYGAAIEADRITPGTALRDAPIAEFDWDLGVHWKPTNSGRSFRGAVLAIDALASSLNAPAVDVFDRVGADAVIGFSRRMGLSTDMVAVRPLALGSSCVIPSELTGVYASIAQDGARVPARFVVSIEHRRRMVVDHASPLDPYLDPARVLDRLAASTSESRRQQTDPATAFMLRAMLRAVVERGTGTGVRSLPQEVAGKTGTTNDNTDAWFVGFTDRIAAAVWLGHDDPSKALGPGMDGGRAALPLWRALVSLAEGPRRAGDVIGPRPDDVVQSRVDRETGLLARPGAGNAQDVYFRVGTEPTVESSASAASSADVSRMTRDF